MRQRYCVCPSVCPIRPQQHGAVSLLLWAPPAGNIDRLQQARPPSDPYPQQHGGGQQQVRTVSRLQRSRKLNTELFLELKTNKSVLSCCLQLDNVTLLAVAVERRTCSSRSISPARAGPTAANSPHAAAAVDRWDRRTQRRTDGRTPYRYIDTAAYYASSVNKI